MAINLKKFDNKLEKFNDKKKISAIILSLIMIVSIGLCMMYPKIEDKMSIPIDDYYDSEEFISFICNINYVIYNEFKPDSLVNESQKNDIKYFLEEEIPYWNNQIMATPSLWIYAREDSTGNLSEKNDYRPGIGGYRLDYEDGAKNIFYNYDLLNNEIKSKYRFYCVLEFKNNGNIEIKSSYGIRDEETFANAIKKVYKKKMNENKYLNNIKDMTVTYAVPKELIFHDNIYYGSRMITTVEEASFDYLIIATFIIFTLGIFIPYKKSKYIVGFNKIKRIPFEAFILLSILSFIVIGLLPRFLINETIIGTYSSIINNIDLLVGSSKYIVYAINIIIWSLCYFILFYEITYVKYIFKEDIKKYFKEDILIVRFLRIFGSYISKMIGKLWNYISNIKLNKENNKIIILVILSNFFVTMVMSYILLMCLDSFGGEVYLIIFSTYFIISFIIVKRIENKISSNYKRLLKQTNEMANGNLDFKVDEDLGMFNELKDELQKIQGGFKKAVDEEVKSQNMKTELISNVSHDLKTPLTSIISYVDLLKSEKDEEKKRQYIETLDKKSQRLKVLIEDLFEMSKASSGNINLNIIEVDIISLIKQTMIELNDKIKDSTVKFKFNNLEEKIILPLDSQRTFRVFENLILNITKYSMQNSRAYIDVKKVENKVQITLRNISENELDFREDEIIERFVRGDKSRNTEGSGLGLAIAKSFIELQGGTFNISLDGDLFKVTIIFKID